MKVPQYIGATHGDIPVMPSTAAYEKALSQAAAGMNEITKGAMALGKIGDDILKKRTEERRENTTQAMKIQASREFMEFEVGFDRSNPDPATYASTKIKAWDDIVKKNSGTTRDAETSKRFKNWADNQKIKVMTNSYSQANKRFQDSYFFEFENNIEEIKKLAIDSENLEDSEDNKNWMLREIESGLGFPLTAERAVQLRDKNLEEIKTGRAKNAINRLELDILRDPGGTIQKLMMPPESNNYPEITDPLIREQKIKLGERLLETQQKERRTEEDRIKGENHDAEALEIGNLYATGKLKIEHVQAAKYLSGGEKIQLTDKIRERQDRLARGEIIKTNFSTYARIQDMIYSGQPKREITKRIALASEKDLSEQDAETLLNKSTAYGGHIEDQWRKKSYDFLKSQIAASGTNMLGDFVNPEEAIDFFKATNSLDSAIAKTKQQGKPFSPEQIFEEARKILPLFKRTQKQLAEAAKERMKGEKSKINVPERKKGESASDYLKRTGGE